MRTILILIILILSIIPFNVLADSSSSGLAAGAFAMSTAAYSSSEQARKEAKIDNLGCQPPVEFAYKNKCDLKLDYDYVNQFDCDTREIKHYNYRIIADCKGGVLEFKGEDTTIRDNVSMVFVIIGMLILLLLVIWGIKVCID